MKDKNSTAKPASINNIYSLTGRVPLIKAVPFGLQHILAMFVANIAPILIVGAASGLDAAQLASLIQSAMMIAELFGKRYRPRQDLRNVDQRGRQT